MPRREEKRRDEKEEETGKMTVEEAGRRGGEATKETHGRGFYEEIGKKGGEERVREIREEGISPQTREKLSQAGRKGGETTKKTHGREFYEEIGKKGGAAPKGASERGGSAGRGKSAGRGGTAKKGEVIVRRSGKDIDVMFSSQEEAEEWRNHFAPMMEEEGYHFTREKPETTQGEAAIAAG